MRGSLNIGAMMKFARGPGMDTRVWLTFAQVDAVEVVTGKNAGIYVDITCMPHGEEYTAWVASPYAGNAAGMYFPMKVNDTVLVAIPYGDSAAGIAIIGRFNAGDAAPPDDFIKNGGATDEIVLVAEQDVNIRYVMSGSGNFVVEPRGTGKFAVGGDPGSAGMEAMVLGEKLTQALNDIKAAHNGHFHPALTLPAGPTGPIDPTSVIGIIPNIKADKGEVR